MPNTYVVSSATQISTTVTIVGTVDTSPSTGPIAVTVTMDYQPILQAEASGGASAVQALIAPPMLSAALGAGLQVTPVAVTQIPTGTFTL